MVELSTVPAASLAVDSRLLNAASTVLVLAVSSAPMLTAELVSAPCTWLVRFVPLLGRVLAALLRRAAAACASARAQREQVFVLLHGAVTYALGDVIAQAAMREPSDGGSTLWVPSTTMLAAVVGLLSDSLPFYHWSVLLQTLSPEGRRAGVITRVPLLRGRPALLLPMKIGMHLLAFQPLSTGLYLFLQGLSKHGGSASAALAFLRARFITNSHDRLADDCQMRCVCSNRSDHRIRMPVEVL